MLCASKDKTNVALSALTALALHQLLEAELF
jgi:hypothetical protein